MNYFVCVGSPGIFQGSNKKTAFFVVFFLKCTKKIILGLLGLNSFIQYVFDPLIVFLQILNSRNSHIRGPYDISSFFVKKLCFSVFLLNSIANKDSRLNSGVQFHLMVPSQMYERVLQKQPPEMFYNVFLEILQNSQENTCARESFSYEFCEISKNTFPTEQLQATVSGAEFALV